MLFVIAGAVLVGLAIMAFVCWLLMGCFQRIPPAFRKMEPGLVWLLMIPCFGTVWAFFVCLRLPESFQAYFAAQGKADGSDYGRGLGLAYAISSVCSMVPFLNYLAGPVALVLLIIFLVKMTGYKGQIPEGATAVPGFQAPPPPPLA